MPLGGGNNFNNSPVSRKIRTPSGNILTVGNISDGQYFQLSGSTLQGSSSTSIFGSNFETSASTGVSTTTSSTFQTKLTHTTASVPSGTYRIGWTFLWSHSSTLTDMEVEVRVDATQIWLLEVEPQDGDTAQRYSAAGFHYATFGSSGVHILDIRYRSELGIDTARIAEARLEFWRVS